VSHVRKRRFTHLHLVAGAVGLVVERSGFSRQAGHDEARIGSLRAELGFDNDPPRTVPRLGSVVEPGKEPRLFGLSRKGLAGPLHERPPQRFQPRVAREANDIIDLRAFAPAQNPPAAKPRVGTHGEAHLRPRRSQARNQQFQNRPRVMGRIDIAGAQIRDQELLATKDVERQKATIAIVAVVVPAFLLAMDAIIRGIEIEDQLRGRRGKGSDELVDEDPVKIHRRLPIAPLLEPAQRRIARQGRVALERRLPRQIRPQLIVIIEILVAVRDPVDALPRKSIWRCVI
jgi:hypothetical protein